MKATLSMSIYISKEDMLELLDFCKEMRGRRDLQMILLVRGQYSQYIFKTPYNSTMARKNFIFKTWQWTYIFAKKIYNGQHIYEKML